MLSRSRILIRTLNPRYDYTKSHRISTSPFLSQEAQLAEESPQPPPPHSTPLPPNPASGSPYYNQNWRNPYSQPPPGQSYSLIPVNNHRISQIQALSKTLDAKELMELFAEWTTTQRWADVKQLYEFWVSSLDKDGKPNKPDVNLFNLYLRAHLMDRAPAVVLQDLIEQLEDFGVRPNTASFNLVLKAMDGESEDALKLFERMLLREKEALPDDETYDLVLGMLFQRSQVDIAVKYLDAALKSGYTMSMKVFNAVLVNCMDQGRLDSMVSIIEQCMKMVQNKALCPSWSLCNEIADIGMQSDHGELAFHALSFLAKWIQRGETEKPPVLRTVDQGLLVSALATAGRTYNPKLLDGSWKILMRTMQGNMVPSPECFLAKIYASSSLGNLPKAFFTLRELEAAYGNSDSRVLEELLSPFTSLNPLVLACSKKGFTTLDEVYYQLENLTKADPPYKSLAALNCIVLGCANIWDVDRAYQTFIAINASFGLTPNIHSYNSLICAFMKLNKRDEAIKVFDHFVGLGLKPNATTYSLLVDVHLTSRDPKAAISAIEEMAQQGYTPLKETLKKVRRRCVRELDNESDGKLEALAKQFNIRMGTENRRNMLFNLDYSTTRAA